MCRAIPDFHAKICMRGYRVWKFGGSSLANAERITQVVELIRRHGLQSMDVHDTYISGNNADSLVVVVSAIAGVTNLLVKTCEAPSKAEMSFVLDRLPVLDEIVMKHQCLIADLIKRETLGQAEGQWLVDRIKTDCFSKIRSLLEACSIIGNVPNKISEIIKGFGEIWSSLIMSHCMRSCLLGDGAIAGGSDEAARAFDSAECPNLCLVFDEAQNKNSTDTNLIRAESEDENTVHVTVLNSPWNCQGLIQLQKPFLADENPTVDMELSKKLLAENLSGDRQQWLDLRDSIARHYGCQPDDVRMRSLRFATGYVCRDHEGASATLGRNGSDYTGAILANCLSANSYTIWSDVEGVFTADPRIISEARCVPVLSYEEAMELSFFGASVIHPLTMQPLISADIPIFMKSSYFPQKNGTVICRVGRTMEIMSGSLRKSKPQATPHNIDDVTFAGVSIKDLACKSITTIGGVSMLTILGAVVSAKRGLSRRMFATLDELDIQVLMICQASSDYCVSLAIKSTDVAKAVEGLEKEFFGEMIRWSSFKIKVLSDLAILCTVGEGQRNKIGYFSSVTSAMAETDTSIIACVQSPSERLIAFVIHQEDRQKVVKRLHQSLFPQLTEAHEDLPEGNAKNE